MKYLLTFFCLVIIEPLLAQSEQNFLPGYVVLLNGDTLSGLVMDRDESAFGGLLNKVKFRPDKGWRKKYKPSQIKYYQRGGDLFKSLWLTTETKILKQYYYSRPGQGEQVFVKVVYRGSIYLYHREYTIEDNSMIDFVPLISKKDNDEMVRATQGIFGLKRKRLAKYFAECPRLSTALLGKKISTIDEVIRIYENNCTQ